MKTDNKTLVENIDLAFEMAGRSDLSNEVCKEYLNKGFQLRARLITLLASVFEDGTPQVTAANKQIKAVNKRLKEVAEDIQQAADTLVALSNLVTVLDDLIKLPFSVI
ncbi:MAG: hypothetical protein KA368_18100 [Acidobacteria bacterium]|nr:hypothetical protein [Acidobacteriota bacterium]